MQKKDTGGEGLLDSVVLLLSVCFVVVVKNFFSDIQRWRSRYKMPPMEIECHSNHSFENEMNK